MARRGSSRGRPGDRRERRSTPDAHLSPRASSRSSPAGSKRAGSSPSKHTRQPSRSAPLAKPPARSTASVRARPGDMFVLSRLALRQIDRLCAEHY
ncbi:MAG: hypothetical protein ACK462_08065, partial [Planctomyces sp.]